MAEARIRKGGSSRRRCAAALAMLAALALARPAAAAQTPDGDDSIDVSYRLQRFDGSLRNDPFRLYLLTSVMPQNGMLRVCGIYVADMSDARFAQLGADLRDMNSALRVGAPDRRGVRLRPSFLAARRAIVLEDLEGKPRLPEGLQANCVITDAAWQERFNDEPVRLELTRTRFRSLLLQYWR